ncbi:MAG: hypothetical protein WCH83_00140 [Alphaproteobacteria bacterium]
MAKPHTMEAPSAGANVNTIDQVRELLFGADKRTHEQRLQELDDKITLKIEEMHSYVEKRFAELEASLKVASATGDDNRRKAVEQIGEAIASLGMLVKNQAN